MAEINSDVYYSLRLESIFRRNEDFAVTFYHETEKMTDDEVIKLLKTALIKSIK
jgi:hypothetical protein